MPAKDERRELIPVTIATIVALPPDNRLKSDIAPCPRCTHEGRLEHECVSANFAYDRAAKP
jgi:hypothetical protein